MKINLPKKILYILSFSLLASCATQEKNNWIVAKGKYAQTWMDGIILMEVSYGSSEECRNSFNHELNINSQLQRKVLIDKSMSLVCAEKEITKDLFKFDENGLASPAGGLPYQGFIRLATSTEKYSAWFPGKEVCEFISSELKMQNKNQDLVCP
jgi:hypothetical protein